MKISFHCEFSEFFTFFVLKYMYIDNKDDKNTPKIPPNTYDAKHNTNVTNLL